MDLQNYKLTALPPKDMKLQQFKVSCDVYLSDGKILTFAGDTALDIYEEISKLSYRERRVVMGMIANIIIGKAIKKLSDTDQPNPA